MNQPVILAKFADRIERVRTTGIVSSDFRLPVPQKLDGQA